ncbi:MAG: hypothetical protein GY888_13335, partial [Planctomycetaceae bacterium]|nr:hypothetical protein [Planctomycetaceae bacterium]
IGFKGNTSGRNARTLDEYIRVRCYYIEWVRWITRTNTHVSIAVDDSFLTPINVELNTNARTGNPLARRKTRPTIKRAELANFVRELATALEAGLPLMQAMRTVREQARGPAMPVILDFLIERVEAGTPLFSAAKEYGEPFDDLIIGMFRAADASGRMDEVLHQLASLLDRSIELRREIIGAVVYPLIVAGLLAVSTVILVTVILPMLMKPIENQPNFNMP